MEKIYKKIKINNGVIRTCGKAFCTHCGNMVYHNDRDYLNFDKNIPNECPICGKKIDKENQKWLSSTEVKNAELNSVTIYEKNDNIHIFYSYIIYFYNRNTQKVQKKSKYKEYILNPYTEKVYATSNIKGQKSFSMVPVWGTCSEEIDAKNAEKILHILAEKKGDTELYKKAKNRFLWAYDPLLLYNTIPNIFLLHNIEEIPIKKLYDLTKNIKKICKTEEELLYEIIKSNKLPKNKSLMREYVDDGHINVKKLYITYCLKEIGFTDVNYYKTILNKYENGAENYFNPHISKIEKAFVRERGEKRFVKAYLSNECLLFVDVELLWGSIKETHPEALPRYRYMLFKNNKKSLDKIHSELTLLYHKLARENKIIPYSKKEKKLEYQKNDYLIKLAPDTYSLIDAGETLNICIGGYGDMAVNKDCTLMFFEKNEKLIGCLEIKGDEVIQIKGNNNYFISEEKEVSFIKDFIKEKKLDVSNCSDYKHLGENRYAYRAA